MDKVVYIAGCFDLLHKGHINIIKNAKKMGDFLVVAVNSDEFIYSYKNKYPVINENDRLIMIRALKYVDMAFILEDHESQQKYINILKPKYIVHGSDWQGDSLLKQMNITEEMVEKYNIEMKIFDYTQNVSTTIIRTQIEKK